LRAPSSWSASSAPETAGDAAKIGSRFDVEDYARDLGVLQKWERMEKEEES